MCNNPKPPMTTFSRLIILCSFCMLPSVIQAIQKDSISIAQYVRDSFTRYGVKNALVTVMDSTGNVIDTTRTIPGAGDHDGQIWSILVPRKKNKFRISVQHPDYETKEMEVEMGNPARLNSYTFPEMLLKRIFAEKETELGEVTVCATRVKLCYKGDTLEVDARAFRLSEGSMLESLVRNIPGAELKDNGDIYMNGKKVDYLTLNGKDFFKGNNRVMLDNLPYYTVDKLQFFHQSSERSLMAGRDVERQDYIMNVKLKQEYNTGYLGNVEAGIGTHERWLGRGFALRFTDNSRLSLFGNANNVNDKRKPGGNGAWENMSSPEGNAKTYHVGGELLVDDKKGLYKEVLNATFLWNRDKGEQRLTSQQFLQQGDLFRYGNELTHEKNFSFHVNNHLALKRIGAISDTRIEYSDVNNWSLSRNALFAQQMKGGTKEVLDSVFSAVESSQIQDILVNRVKDDNANVGNKWMVEQKLDYHKTLPWGDDLMLFATGQWSKYKNDRNSLYSLHYTNEDMQDDVQNRYKQEQGRSYHFNAKATYAIHFLTGWHLNISYAHHQQHSHDDNNLYRLDWDDNYRQNGILPSQTDYFRLRDDRNSPHNRLTISEEHVIGSLHRHDYDSKRGRYFSLTALIDASYAVQKGTYSRGVQIAKPTDGHWLVNPSVDMEYETRNWRDAYQIHYDTKMRSPNLEQMTDMEDTSNPLVLQKGNPNLRPSQIHNGTLSFRSRFGTHGQFVMLRTNISVKANLVAMNSIYNSVSGAYTYIPVNINGNWSSNNSIEFRRALTTNRKMNLETRTTYDYIHGVDMKDNQKSTVAQHIVGQNIKLDYKSHSSVLSLLGGLSWREAQINGNDNIHNVDFNYGASIQADLPFKIRLSTDIKMYSRRGYADRSLCTNNLLWNAQLDYSTCKGHILISAKAFDILHQISTTYSTVNSQARMETWRLSLPSYFMLCIQFKFNKNPKRK